MRRSHLKSTSYTYDNLNRLSTVSEGGTLQATYTYDTNGNRQTLTYANGVVESYQYNKANWITNLTNSKDGTTLSSYAYTYYTSGSQKSETDHNGVVTGYTYDDLGRLTQESETNGLTLSYTYDANGNRTQMTASGTDSYTTAYTYDANNRLTMESKTQGGTTTTSVFTYDDNGNLLTELDATNTAVVTHSYNSFSRLTSSVVGTTTITYAYNAQGIRTGRYVNGTLTRYLLDGGNVVGEITDGTPSALYVRGANLIQMQYSTGEVYYLYNAHGDVVQLTDSTGAVRKSYDYDAFGNEKAPADGDTNPFRYCGEYYDTATGLYYLRARYYDPTVGRFAQEDTHWNTANMIYGDNPQKINEREDALGLKTYSYAPQILSIMQAGNLYGYCTNSPVMYADPSGDLIISTLALLMIGGAVLCGTIGGIWGYNAAEQAGLTGWDKAIYTTNSALFGGIIGSLGGYVLAPFVVSATGVTGINILSAGEIASATYTGSIALRDLTQRNFRANLQIYTGFSGIGYEAHHVFPVKFVEDFRAIGIDIHNPIFGAWVNPAAHHSWSHAYNQIWMDFFNSSTLPTFEGAIQLAIQLAKIFGYSLNFG